VKYTQYNLVPKTVEDGADKGTLTIDGNNYIMDISGETIAIDNTGESGHTIPAHCLINVGEGNTLKINQTNEKNSENNTALRMSASVPNPFGLTIKGNLDITSSGGIANSDGIVYVCEQPSQHAGKNDVYLKITESMTVNVSNVVIQAGSGKYYNGSYGVGILEGDFEVGTSKNRCDFTLSMSEISNANEDANAYLYALGLGGGFNEEGVDRSYTFHGSVNIGCEKNDEGELVDKAVKLKSDETYAISDTMVLYGITLNDYRDTCSHEDSSTGNPIPPTGTGLSAMTVEEDLNVKNVRVVADAASAEVYGLEATGENSSVTVEGITRISGIEATTKSGESTYAVGIEAGWGAQINLKGGATIEDVTASGGAVNDAYVVVSYGGAAVNINAAALAQKVVVKGDTLTAGDGSKIVMNLNHAESEFRGYTLDDPMVDEATGEAVGVNATDIGVSNGGTWYVPGDNHLKGTLTMGNGGVVAMPTPGKSFTTLTTDKLTGNDGVFRMNVNTELATADHLVIGSGSGAHYLSIANKAAKSSNTDILVVTQNSGNAGFRLANEVIVGNYTYALRTDELGDGRSLTYLTLTDQLSPAALASLSMASVGAAYSAYQGNLGNLRSRLGEVRNHSGRKGLWGQVNFWKDEADSFAGTSFSQDVMALSVGYDVKPNKRWIVGMGLSAGIHDRKGGKCVGRVTADANSVFVSPYGTWTHENGTYVDIVGAFGVYDQDFDLYRPGQAGVSGSYTDFGAGISVEVGRKFTSRRTSPGVVDAKGATVSTVKRPALRGWFVEPQAQLSFYNVFADDYTTNEGSTAKRDDVQALSGRVGLAAGKDFTYGANKKGQVYVKGGYIHEFCGDQRLELNGDSFSADTILGSRFYYGIGVDMELRNNLNIYGEIGREEGTHYTREYDVRCGIKFSY